MIMRASCDNRWVAASPNGDLTGPLAIMICEPRQARKGATVAVSYVPGCGWLGCLLNLPLYPIASFRLFILFYLLVSVPQSKRILGTWCLFPPCIAIIAT